MFLVCFVFLLVCWGVCSLFSLCVVDIGVSLRCVFRMRY